MKVKILVTADITFDDGAPDPEPDSLTAEELRDSAREAVRNALDIVRNAHGFTHTYDVATSIDIVGCELQQAAIAAALPLAWITHDGSAKAPVTDIVEIEYRDGHKTCGFSQVHHWGHYNHGLDIVAYRMATGLMRERVLERFGLPEDGWKIHDGQSNPAPGRFVDARDRNLALTTCIESENCTWSHDDPEDRSAIVYYRISPKK